MFMVVMFISGCELYSETKQTLQSFNCVYVFVCVCVCVRVYTHKTLLFVTQTLIMYDKGKRRLYCRYLFGCYWTLGETIY